MTLLLRAPLVLAAAGPLAPGGVLVARGRIARVVGSAAGLRRAAREARRVVDLDGCTLAPGLVNAHAHLELTGLAGRVPAADGFAGWVRGLLEERSARGAAALERDARRGAARCLATGTTTVGDVDTTGAAERALGRAGPRVVLFREVLDAHDPARTADALARVARRLPPRARRVEGVSPHAPFTTSPALLAGVARLRARRRLPLAVHWAETPEEGRWLERGEGPLAALLPPSPRRRGLDLLADAGLLAPPLALVHGNCPGRGEPARVAASGASLVHCPGTHAFFGRPPFPWRRWLAAGVPLALGTDSLASNDDLDLRREMARARAAAPWLAPGRVLAMATSGGARALGLEGELGALRRGLRADLVAHRLEAADPAAAVDALTSGAGEVAGAWVGGKAAAPEFGFAFGGA